MNAFVLVTGASSGIGESLVSHLVASGYHVLAGVRNEHDGDRLASMNNLIHPLMLDVTSEDQIASALSGSRQLIGDGRLVAIINNAGIVVSGAALYIPLDQWKHQFEVNLFGVIRVTQAFMPFLIAPPGDTHPRRIINMSSVSGKFASPFLAPYASSKFALEAFSDALRRELYMYDIQVVVIQPGSIKTPLWQKAMEAESFMGPEYESIRTFKNKVIKSNVDGALEADQVSARVVKVIKARRVAVRYLIKAQAWKFRVLRLLPVKWVDRMIRQKLQSQTNIRPF